MTTTRRCEQCGSQRAIEQAERESTMDNGALIPGSPADEGFCSEECRGGKNLNTYTFADYYGLRPSPLRVRR